MRTNGTVWGKIVKALNKHDSLFLRVSVLRSPYKLPEQAHTESGTAGSMSIPGIPKPGCLLRGEPLERHSLIASGGVHGAGAVGAAARSVGPWPGGETWIPGQFWGGKQRQSRT